jgi:hypothetical protein
MLKISTRAPTTIGSDSCDSRTGAQQNAAVSATAHPHTRLNHIRITITAAILDDVATVKAFTPAPRSPISASIDGSSFEHGFRIFGSKPALRFSLELCR